MPLILDRPIRHRARRGFTLMEALMASGILLVVVVAVTSAITAGQQNAFEAHQRIAGTLAAEDLMGRLVTEPYAALPSWHGFNEDAGTMTDVNGDPLPPSFDAIGRDAQVTTEMKTVTDLAINVQGRTVRVRTYDADGRVLADLGRFIPEPQ